MTETLPEDPRDCCRAALLLMIADRFDDSLVLVRDVLDVTWAALGNGDERDRTPESVRAMIDRAQDAYRDVLAHLDKVQKVIRHGTNDHREMDARLAAIDEGREPPYEPTGYEVRGAMIASEAAGRRISEDEAIALLRAHGKRDAA
jgi:hypothetical protein